MRVIYGFFVMTPVMVTAFHHSHISHVQKIIRTPSFTPEKRHFMPLNLSDRTDKRLGTSYILSKSTSTNDDGVTKKKKSKGVYARPSAAIERGSGFFVPGLEGSRVRVLFGILVLVLNFVNQSLVESAGGSDVKALSALGFSGKVSGFFGLLLLLQGSVEFAKELGLGVETIISTNKEENNDNTKVSSNEELTQSISALLKERGTKAVESVCWAAASFVALTPATHVMLLEVTDVEDESGNILYSLGSRMASNEISTESQTGVKAAIEAVYRSNGGRISVPPTHPSSVALLPEENRRCVLLQKIPMTESDSDRKMCLFVGSDQLLAAFTKNDLKWLGRLGTYLSSR